MTVFSIACFVDRKLWSSWKS